MRNPYINRIKRVYPSLMIEEYERSEIGQNNDVFIVNKNIVFRFPKYTQGIETMKQEKDLLETINPFLSVQIPNPIYQSFEELEVGKAFMGYPLIPGASFLRNQFLSIKDNQVINNLAIQLVQVLLEIHSFTKEKMDLYLQLNYKDPNKEISELYDKLKNKLFNFIREDAQKEIKESFETFLSKSANVNFKPTLIHGDFGGSNIIWSSETKKLTGIIDFGSAGLGDPAYDFAGLLSSYGEAFFNLCISLYPNGSEISERVKFYRSTFALQEALHGIENNDAKAFEAGITEYR